MAAKMKLMNLKSIGEDLKFFIMVVVFSALVGGGVTLGSVVVWTLWVRATDGVG